MYDPQLVKNKTFLMLSRRLGIVGPEKLVFLNLTMYMYLCMCLVQLKQKCVYDVKTIVQSITQEAKNELEQLRAIWVWLCNNIGELTKTHNPNLYYSIIIIIYFFIFLKICSRNRFQIYDFLHKQRECFHRV